MATQLSAYGFFDRLPRLWASQIDSPISIRIYENGEDARSAQFVMFIPGDENKRAILRAVAAFNAEIDKAHQLEEAQCS